jgi:hypothetical protein
MYPPLERFVGPMSPLFYRIARITLDKAVQRRFIPPAQYMTFTPYLIFNHPSLLATVFPITFSCDTNEAKKPWLEIKDRYVRHNFLTIRELQFDGCKTTVRFIFGILVRLKFLSWEEYAQFERFILRGLHRYDDIVLHFFFEADVRPNYSEILLQRYRTSMAPLNPLFE